MKNFFECSSDVHTQALRNTTLAMYKLPNPRDLSKFLKPESADEFSDCSIDKFLPPFAKQNLEMAIPAMLLSPIPITIEELADKTTYETADEKITRKMDFYIELIIDVLSNELSKEPYDNSVNCVKENVSERTHALQAAKIALMLQMNLADILSLLLHDIARPTINDTKHGHLYHTEEGYLINLPLGEEVANYSLWHAYAKHLNVHFLNPDNGVQYNSLLSPLSRLSLALQQKNWSIDFIEKEADNVKLITLAYKNMYKRVIDEFSKLPDCEKAIYPSNQQIRVLLKQQMAINFALEKKRDEKLAQLNEQLDAAIDLLTRAHDYSNNRQLYEEYQDLFRIEIVCAP